MGLRPGPDLLPELAHLKDRPWQPDSWSPRHRMVVALYATGAFTNKQISEITGISYNRISIIINDPRAQFELREFAARAAEHVADVHSMIRFAAVEAFQEIMDEMRNSKNENVRQRAAFGILDRAGYTPVQKHLVGRTELPAGLAERVEETSRELKEIVGASRFVAPEASGEG